MCGLGCTEPGITPPDEASGRGGGDMGKLREARREAWVEFCRDSEPETDCMALNGLPETLVRGDGGTEFRSGAMVLGVALVGCRRYGAERVFDLYNPAVRSRMNM